MSGLIAAIQGDALSTEVGVSTLLRKAKLAAAKLDLAETEAWVESELNGYGQTEIPPYRVLIGEPKIFNPYNGWIPIGGDPKTVRSLSKVRCRQSVAEIEELLDKSDGILQSPLPPEVVNELNRSNGVNFGQAAVFLSRSELAGILDSVRNKVLDWSIALEKKGIMGEGLSFSNSERALARDSSPSIYIHSVGTLAGNVGVGNSSGDISATVNEASLFKNITQALEKSIADTDERQALVEAVSRMENAQGSRSQFSAAYTEFITIAAAHMTAIAPFLPALGRLLA